MDNVSLMFFVKKALHFLFVFVCILQSTSARSSDLPDGTWRLSEYVYSGMVENLPYAFLRINKDGTSEVCNGVEKLPCSVIFKDRNFELYDPSGLAWPTGYSSNFSKIEGVYLQTEKSLVLAVPSFEHAGFSPDKFFSSEEFLSAATEVYRFERFGDSAELDSVLDRGDPALNEYIDQLVQLNAEFKVNEIGKIVEISFVNCAAESVNIELLETLPSLQKIYLAKNTLTVPESNKVEVQVSDMSSDREWMEKNEGAGGKLVHQGRRERSKLESRSDRTNRAPVFSTMSKDSTGSAVASLVSFRGKAYAFHFHPSAATALPHEMSHPSLGAPVRLGRVLLSRLGFVVREIVGNPGPEWLFMPLPEKSSVFENGQIWQVCLPGGSYYEGVTGVGVANGIVPGGRIDWGTVELFLTSRINGDLSEILGCPIVDAKTGYLIGFVSNVYLDETVEIEINTFTDLTSLPESRESYEGISFFGIPGRLSPEEVSSNLVGVFRSEILNFPLGEEKTKSYLLSRPYFHYNNLMELPGREYLFSRIEYPNPTLIRELRASSIQLQNHDLRLREFSEFLLAHLGEATELGGSFPEGDGKYGYRIEFRWEGKDFTVFYQITQQKIGNKSTVTLEIGKSNGGSPPALTQIDRDETNGLRSRELLSRYFEWLDSLDPDFDRNGFDDALKELIAPR